MILNRICFGLLIITLSTVRAADNVYNTSQLLPFLGLQNKFPQVILENLLNNGSLSSACQHHVTSYLNAINSTQAEEWALQMLDSTAKPESGLFLGGLLWPGRFWECLAVGKNTERTGDVRESSFTGQYCLVKASPTDAGLWLQKASHIPLQFPLRMGICLPSSCTNTEIESMLSSGLQFLNLTPEVPAIACQTKHRSPFKVDISAIFAIIFFLFFVVLSMVGTVYHTEQYFENRYQPRATDSPTPITPDATLLTTKEDSDRLRKALLSFSVFRHWKRLFTTSNHTRGSLDCLYGIRFFSIAWVVLGHTYSNINSPIYKNINIAINEMGKIPFQIILNGTFSVDSFFFLSGLLVTYVGLKVIHKEGGKLNLFKFYFHRIWRLTPPYAALLAFTAGIWLLLGNGPLWYELENQQHYCRVNWWANLLYLNNFLALSEPCQFHTWYLANDFQFYAISPVILILLYRKPKYGLLLISLGLVLCWIISGLLVYLQDIPPVPQFYIEATRNRILFESYYMKPYCRIGPYLIGMLIGYFVFKKSTWKLPTMSLLIGWLVAIASSLAVLYSLNENFRTNRPPALILSAVYGALARSVWAAAVGWVVVVCSTGQARFIDDFLSWKGFLPLCKLTYCVYLFHVNIRDFIYTSEDGLYFSHLSLVQQYLSLMVVAHVVAVAMYLLFEAPMMDLEKVLLSLMSSRTSRKETSKNMDSINASRVYEEDDKTKQTAIDNLAFQTETDQT